MAIRRSACSENSVLYSLRNRYKGIIDRYEAQKEQPKFPMELHVIGLDDVAFASNQFELYMDYQHRIQARQPVCADLCRAACRAERRRRRQLPVHPTRL